MADHFDFGPIRDVAIGLIKQFSQQAPIILLRNVNTTPANPAQPWEGAAARILQFTFNGTVSTLGFPKRSDPIMDRDIDVVAPGDLATTVADQFLPAGFPQPGLGIGMSVKLGVGGFGSIHGGGDLGVSMSTALNITTVCGFPATTDRLLIGKDLYAILGVQDVTPDSQPILFKLRCRAWPVLNKQGGVPY